METITISGTDIEVGRVALGTWAIGGWMWGGSDAADAVAAVQAAVDRGINLVDTAPVYGAGRSEELVGRALAAGGRRQRAVLATKAGLEYDGKLRRNSRPERLRQELEGSLRRLGTDVIDIYQVHWPDEATPFEETAEALRRFHEEGKIRAVGVSNFSPEQMEAFREAAPLHTAQPPYNLFERGIEQDVLPYCREHDVTTLLYGPLCRGLLTGRMRPETTFAGDDIRKVDPKFEPPRYGQYLRAVERLQELARRRYERSITALAVRWVLDQPGASVALWGARRPAQLDSVAEVWGWHVDDEGEAEIDGILRESIEQPVGPEFMAPPRSRR